MPKGRLRENMAGLFLTTVIVLVLISTAIARQCYDCTGLAPETSCCQGTTNTVTCSEEPQYCGVAVFYQGTSESGLVVNVQAGATAEESAVTATGQVIHIITDKERSSFGIESDSDLKGAVESYFGKWPNDAYLHSPTPWGDLYERYDWDQVQMVLKPKRAHILQVNTKPTILATKTLKNESNKTGTFSTSISEQVTDTVSNTWERSTKISIDQMIKYNIAFLGTGGGGETTFGFEQSWGSSQAVSKETTVGTETGVTVELGPGESAIVELEASSGTMKVRITYEAHLKGRIALNYDPAYKGHHFWGLSINATIGSSANKVQVVQDMEIGYCSDAVAILKSVKTNETLVFHLAEHPDEPPKETE